MPSTARPVDPLPEEVLEAAVTEFKRCAVKALEGLVPNKRKLANRLGWPETTLGSALKGGFTFHSWAKICRALGRDPIDELVRGRAELRKTEEETRAEAYLERSEAFRQMLELAQVDAMVAFWRRLSPEERELVRRQLIEEDL